MNHITRITCAVGIAVATLGVSGTANAATASSTYMWAQAGEAILCTITNVSDKPIDEVTLDVIANGTSIASGSCMALAPGTPCFVYGPVEDSGFCKVEWKGSKKAMRGAAQTRNGAAVNYSVPIE